MKGGTVELGTTRCVHIVGIGGAGMSAIAELLLKSGFCVRGSDLGGGETTRKLAREGAVIFQGHDEGNLGECDVVVYSSAVPRERNVELLAAEKRGIPVIKRDEMLGELMRFKSGICVAGTHGKTTTTAMIATMLVESGDSPTVMIGGVSDYLGGSTLVGNGRNMVIEADEYDRAFLKLTPTVAIVNSLEAEHADTYASMDELRDAFTTFANSVPFYGKVIACVDWPEVRKILSAINRRTLTYAIDEHADLMAQDIEVRRTETRFRVLYHRQYLGDFTISVPGRHNVHNALGALAVGLELGLPVERIQRGLRAFSGMRRRFQIRWETAEGPVVVDDYAHHPSEVKAAIKAAKAGWEGCEVIAVFQPHLFSRTRDFALEFGWALSNADRVFVEDVFPSRELKESFPGISGDTVAEAVIAAGLSHVGFYPSREELFDVLAGYRGQRKLFLFMGAGDITRLASRMAELCQKEGGSPC